jgi:AraC-like DNA-binding protein
MILTNLIIERDSSNLAFIIPSYILQIRNLFDKEYYNSFNLDDLSTKFHVSKYTLSKEFQSFFHIPPIEYLIQKRINIAKTLLMNTNFTINEVAARVGIYNTTHFINLFKKRVGVTPLQYRKNINKELNLLDLD